MATAEWDWVRDIERSGNAALAGSQFTGPTVMDFGKTMEAISVNLEPCPLPYLETISVGDRLIVEYALQHLIGAGHIEVECDLDPDNDMYVSVKPFRVRPRMSLVPGGLAPSPSPSPTAQAA